MASPLPSARDLGVVGVQPSLGVAQRRGSTGLEDAAGKGLSYTAGVFGKVSDMLERAADEFDQTQAEDRYNQMQERFNEMALNPETGWKTAKGENALKPEFLKKHTDALEEERKKLVDTLGSPQAKERFNRMSAAMMTRQRAALYGHVAEERVSYEAKVYDDSMKNVQNNAWRAHGNEDMFQGELARARALTERFMRQNFVGASDESVQKAVQEAESAMWAARVKGALDSGNSKLAKELMGKASGSLITKHQQELGPRISAQARVTEAVDAVDKLFAKHVSSDLNAAFPSAKIDEELRKLFADDPEQLRAARAEADYRSAKLRDAQREQKEASLGAVMDMAFVQRRSESEIMRSPEFAALPGEFKARFVTQMENYRHLQAGRAAAEANRALSNEQRSALARHRRGQEAVNWLMLNPDEARRIASDKQTLYEFAMQNGPENANALSEWVTKKLDKPEKLIKSKMQVDQFKSIIGEYGLYKDVDVMTSRAKNQTTKARQEEVELNTMYRNVNQRIEAKAQELRRDLTSEEKEEIMRSALKERVFVKNGWFSEREMPVLMLPSEGEGAEAARGSARVPMKQLNEASIDTAVRILQGRADIARLSKQQILSNSSYVGMIERAEGMVRAGATDDEVYRFLLGPYYKPAGRVQ